MKLRLGFLLVVLISLTEACTIKFDHPASNSLPEFPSAMVGKYYFRNTNENDSTYLTISKNSLFFTENKVLRGGALSDSMQICKGKKYYYLCMRDSLSDRLVWDVYPIKLRNDRIYFYAIDADYYKKSIKKFFKPIPGYKDLYNMDQKALDKFSCKKLRNKNGLQLRKVQ
ncbi:MAG: hypothetical protein H6605_05400 [Flavobacteriales bacterium]|nr:hypothetical protein [Flavobacteriales bacterium]